VTHLRSLCSCLPTAGTTSLLIIPSRFASSFFAQPCYKEGGGTTTSASTHRHPRIDFAAQPSTWFRTLRPFGTHTNLRGWTQLFPTALSPQCARQIFRINRIGISASNFAYIVLVPAVVLFSCDFILYHSINQTTTSTFLFVFSLHASSLPYFSFDLFVKNSYINIFCAPRRRSGGPGGRSTRIHRYFPHLFMMGDRNHFSVAVLARQGPRRGEPTSAICAIMNMLLLYCNFGKLDRLLSNGYQKLCHLLRSNHWAGYSSTKYTYRYTYL
jgi:hypothetical protein